MAHVVLEHAASMDSLLSDTDLDIVTLLSVGQEESVDEISSYFHHHHGVQSLVGARLGEESQVATFHGREKTESPLVFGNVLTHRKEEGFEEESWDVVELRGLDVGEINVNYQVKGLRSHEMPVIGVYIDRRICLGFKYRVRHLSRQNRYQFSGAALHLTRIGQGYGKRLTFDAEYLNLNPNYFYTDTHDAGFAFSVVAVEAGEKYTIWDAEERAVGHALVLEVNQRQREISSEVENKTVTKRVVVAMKVLVKFTSRRHGMMSLINEETVNVCGLAELEKRKDCRKAQLKCVKNIELPIYGECHFYSESR